MRISCCPRFNSGRDLSESIELISNRPRIEIGFPWITDRTQSALDRCRSRTSPPNEPSKTSLSALVMSNNSSRTLVLRWSWVTANRFQSKLLSRSVQLSTQRSLVILRQTNIGFDSACLGKFQFLENNTDDPPHRSLQAESGRYG